MALTFKVEEIPGGDPGVFWVTPSAKGTGILCAADDREHLITSLGSVQIGDVCELLVELGGCGQAIIVGVIEKEQGAAILRRTKPRKATI